MSDPGIKLFGRAIPLPAEPDDEVSRLCASSFLLLACCVASWEVYHLWTVSGDGIRKGRLYHQRLAAARLDNMCRVISLC
jgi:hypothetical protein